MKLQSVVWNTLIYSFVECLVQLGSWKTLYTKYSIVCIPVCMCTVYCYNEHRVYHQTMYAATGTPCLSDQCDAWNAPYYAGKVCKIEYILLLCCIWNIYGTFCMPGQCAVWNTWGPVENVALRVFSKSWTHGTIGERKNLDVKQMNLHEKFYFRSSCFFRDLK